ncbi:hypothetical protein [Microbacterium elymi]|uniref:DNA-binding protein n=1 Tax=Microbacterium elymi TaxID=2909587 RepID=A0ABY5NJ43_9MICO|nr:hypothetical protein [Microbacterium elymi]UUT35168.1 hypothetical protein L2X98_33525 [Microbacterium elymi]
MAISKHDALAFIAAVQAELADDLGEPTFRWDDEPTPAVTDPAPDAEALRTELEAARQSVQASETAVTEAEERADRAEERLHAARKVARAEREKAGFTSRAFGAARRGARTGIVRLQVDGKTQIVRPGATVVVKGVPEEDVVIVPPPVTRHAQG